MKNLIRGLATIILSCSLQAHNTSLVAQGRDANTSPTVRTANGMVRGVTDDEVSSFKDTMFFKYPHPESNQDLRFRKPPFYPLELWGLSPVLNI